MKNKNTTGQNYIFKIETNLTSRKEERLRRLFVAPQEKSIGMKSISVRLQE